MKILATATLLAHALIFAAVRLLATSITKPTRRYVIHSLYCIISCIIFFKKPVYLAYVYPVGSSTQTLTKVRWRWKVELAQALKCHCQLI